MMGQLGVGSTDRTVLSLQPVIIPDGTPVDEVVGSGTTSFIVSSRRCFACGRNSSGQLGLGHAAKVTIPVELPIPADQVATCGWVTVILSGGTLMAAGDNVYRLISDDTTHFHSTFVPLTIPPQAARVTISLNNMFIRLDDGSWVGRGECGGRFIEPIPEDGFFDLSRYTRVVTGWTRVIEDYAGLLSRRGGSENTMVLPRHQSSGARPESCW